MVSPHSDEADAVELSDRERRVLAAIVESHIDSGEPVGSKALATRPDIQVSSATVRNVMGALADRGLIHQPHTSAGRIPTDRGMRFYIDSLLRVRDPAPADLEEIERASDAANLREAMEETGRVLSRLTQGATLIRAPRPSAARLRHVEFVRLRDDAVLCVLVTAEGLVQNRMVHVGKELAERVHEASGSDRLSQLSRAVSELADGHTLTELAASLDAARAADEARVRETLGALPDELLPLADALIKGAAVGLDDPLDAKALLVEGQAHLLEEAQAEQLAALRELYQAIDDKTQLLELLDLASEAPGIRIFIGEESGYRPLSSMSMVTAPYRGGQDVLGAIGVIGPVHMDYARVVPLVECSAQLVGRLLGPR